MEGGFIGKIKTISDEQKRLTLDNIDSEIKSDLEKDLKTKIPNELVLLGNSIIYESRELPQKEGSSSVEIGKELTAYAIMLSKADLSRKIVSQYISDNPDWDNIKPIINDFSSLSVEGTPTKFETGQKIEITIIGNAKILADISTNVISEKLVGIPKKNVVRLIDEFPGIKSITATIRPIWKQSFPENPSKIHVESSENK